METKVKKITSKEEFMRTSLENAFRSKKVLEAEVSGLKDDLVLTSRTNFERAKEWVSLFYPELDLGILDIFKIVYDGMLVDKEEAQKRSPQDVKAREDSND